MLWYEICVNGAERSTEDAGRTFETMETVHIISATIILPWRRMLRAS